MGIWSKIFGLTLFVKKPPSSTSSPDSSSSVSMHIDQAQEEPPFQPKPKVSSKEETTVATTKTAGTRKIELSNIRMNSANDATAYSLCIGKRRIAHSSASTGTANAGAGGSRTIAIAGRGQFNKYNGSSIASNSNQTNQNGHYPNPQVPEKMVAQHGMVVNQRIHSRPKSASEREDLDLNTTSTNGLELVPYPYVSARLAHRPRRNPTVNSFALVPYSKVPNPPTSSSLELVPYSGKAVRVFDNTNLALDLSSEVRRAKRKIRKFEKKFTDRRIGIGCILKKIVLRRRTIYSVLASTEPIPTENSFLLQKFGQLTEIVGTHGLPDQGFSSPEHGSVSEEDMDQSSDSSYSSTAGADSDSDFVPGKSRK